MTHPDPIIGYIVLAKQAREDGGYDYLQAGGMWTDRERAQVGLAKCRQDAKKHPARYRNIEHIIAEVRETSRD
ncbi:hypothetical protein 7S2_8 [uncultured Caudovirales phage]|uniref:Uncharacterized protein n=1 Tax=uncultured Caudovirales phage TaxID=2100421 RepID=A0A2H4JH14_9CAUD|nr:hypothetical protein 7S2_8 [uncultured Caudovirales phage]